MPVFFHLTPAENVETIMKDGLVAQIGSRSTQIGETQPGVYLFKSLEAAEDGLSNWFGEEFEDDETIALLAVAIEGNVADDESSFEFVSSEDIAADRIRVLCLDVDLINDFDQFSISIEDIETESGLKQYPYPI